MFMTLHRTRVRSTNRRRIVQQRKEPLPLPLRDFIPLTEPLPLPLNKKGIKKVEGGKRREGRGLLLPAAPLFSPILARTAGCPANGKGKEKKKKRIGTNPRLLISLFLHGQYRHANRIRGEGRSSSLLSCRPVNILIEELRRGGGKEKGKRKKGHHRNLVDSVVLHHCSPRPG